MAHLLLEDLRNELKSDDVKHQRLTSNEVAADLLYINTLCDDTLIQQVIISPFFHARNEEEFRHILMSNPHYTPFAENTNLKTLKDQLFQGQVIVQAGGWLCLFNAKNIITKTPDDVKVETTVLGPQKGLSEDLQTSINLIRNRYHNPSLHVDLRKIGNRTQTPFALLYDQGLVDPDLLHEVNQRLSKVNLDVVQSVGQVARHLSERGNILFPTIMTTDRQDRIVLNLSQGKIILFLHGTSFALIVPTVFFDFYSAMDDLYQPYLVGKFLLFLRYIGLFFSIVLPGVYVASVSYNPEVFRVQLAFSIAGSRTAVPYPSYLEVLFMLIMMELLTEASLRLPKAIGQTAATVGGLILGEAATQAGLVSSIMIILIAGVAISNFVIPINTMGFAMRVVKYLILLLATFYGLLGVVGGFLFLIGYLTHLRSMGQPFFKMFRQVESSSDTKGKATNRKVASK
ncbi:spore germination protein [Brevibacillus sp. B_LB10_24]|uniref:spore germination protein n=1 Tax=Brevibacillus sp. B_LB10_24 TaxID=3380645 RepID=UPI0038BADAD9